MKREYVYPRIADRHSRDYWQLAGSLDMRARARNKAMEVLQTHWPGHIGEEIDRQIRQKFNIRLPPKKNETTAVTRNGKVIR